MRHANSHRLSQESTSLFNLHSLGISSMIFPDWSNVNAARVGMRCHAAGTGGHAPCEPASRPSSQPISSLFPPLAASPSESETGTLHISAGGGGEEGGREGGRGLSPCVVASIAGSWPVGPSVRPSGGRRRSDTRAPRLFDSCS